MPVNLDRVTGLVVDILQRINRPVPYSLDRLETYWGKNIHEIFPTPPDTPQTRNRKRWKLGRTRSDDIQFSSTYTPLDPVFSEQYKHQYEECHTVFAKRIRPPGSEGRPRLIYIHGYMQPETPLEETVLVAGLARALKMEIIQVQPPHHGRRKPRSSLYDGEYFWSSDIVRSVESVRQTVWDTQHLLQGLLEEDDRPVGIMGLSLGGTIAAILACIEPRFSFALPLIAHMDLAAVTQDAPVLTRMRRELKEFGWKLHRFSQLLASWGWYDLRPQVGTDHILMLAAKQDRFFPAPKVEAMWSEWEQPTIRWYPTSHMGFIPLLPLALREIRKFLLQRYGHH